METSVSRVRTANLKALHAINILELRRAKTDGNSRARKIKRRPLQSCYISQAFNELHLFGSCRPAQGSRSQSITEVSVVTFLQSVPEPQVPANSTAKR